MADLAPIPGVDCPTDDGCQPFKLEILCDQGAGSVPFLRVYQISCPDGTITGFVDLELDGVTPYVLIGPPVVCAGDITVPAANIVDAELICFDAGPSPLMQVTVYDPTGGVIAGPFFLDPITGLPVAPGGAAIACPGAQSISQILCDEGNANEEFIRFYTLDSGGAVTVTDLDLDGNPYVVIGPVNDCCEALDYVEAEVWVLCDDGTDPATPFLRRYELAQSGPVTTVDTELDGTTPYVVVGSAVVCPTGCEQQTISLKLCDRHPPPDIGDGALVQFIRWLLVDCDGVVISSTDTELDGVTPYAVLGTVLDCQIVMGEGGPLGVVIANWRDDAEYELLCDSGNADTQFLRRYDVDEFGGVTVTDTELDGTTAYVVIGPAALCPTAGTVTVPGTVTVAPLAGQDVSSYRDELIGVGVWALGVDTHGGKVKSISIRRRAGGAAGTVTITDTFGTVTTLTAGESETWSVGPLDDEIIGPLLVTNTVAANSVVILWTEAP